MSHMLLAGTPADLNVKWAQRVINQTCRETTVTKVRLVGIDRGTTTRVRLTVDHNGVGPFPRHWFVKLPPMAWQAKIITALPRLLPTEVRFYRELANTIPLTYPTLLGGHSRFGAGSTLILQDVTEFGATPGHAGDALSFAQAHLVVKQLAQLHAHFWHTADTAQYRWLNGPVRQLEDRLGSILAVPLIRQGLTQAGKVIPKSLYQPALHYARHRKAAMRFLNQGAKTLTHHDCHPGNLFWHNGQPGFLDWQLVRIGEGVSDMAYFLATALNPEHRRQYETQLLDTYYGVLVEKGVDGLTLAHIKSRYRAHLVYPFEAMLDTLAIGGMIPLAENLELLRRATAAVQDHAAFEALPI